MDQQNQEQKGQGLPEDRKKQIQKEFGLSTLSVNNRKTVFLILLIIITFGITSYMNMPRESFPEVQIPEVYVGVPYPGNSPDIIQDKIIRPIENELNTIKNIDEIKSTAIQGYASIQVKFDFVLSPDEAKDLVDNAVKDARADNEFPNDLPAEPTVEKMDITQMPVININLSGNYPVQKLNEKAELLEDELELLSAISSVDIRGVQQQKLNIEIRRDDAEAKRVSFGDIENAIRAGHMNMGAGNISIDGLDHAVIVGDKLDEVHKFDSLIVKSEEGNDVRLFEVAEVYFGDADTTSYARQNGDPVVMLDVQKRGGENLLAAIDSVHAVVERMQESKVIPEDVEVAFTNDQSVQIRDQVSNLENSIIFGVILVVLVLLFFLGSRNALFVGVAIPLSMFMSFWLLSMFGVTLNIMVLFSSVLALGMLVDNGIVVVENVYRWMDEGYSRIEAAKKGVGEVAWPIIASTATTLAAFVPLALWPGIMGEFMQYLPITLMIVLGSSLFVALVINPVLTAVWMRVEQRKPKTRRALIIGLIFLGLSMLSHIGGGTAFGNFCLIIGGIALLNIFILNPGTKFFQNRILPSLENRYLRFVTKSVRTKELRQGSFVWRVNRKANNLPFAAKWVLWLPMKLWVKLYQSRALKTFLFTFLVMFVSIILIALIPPKVLFFPENQPQYINVFIEHPVGTDINVTNKTALEVKGIVDKVHADFNERYFPKPKDSLVRKGFVESIIAQVGEGTSDPMAGPQFGTTPHKARIAIQFTEFKNRGGRETSDFKKMLDTAITKSNFSMDVKLVADKNQDGPPQDPPVNIEITGKPDLPYIELLQQAEAVKKYLEAHPVDGVAKLKLNVETGKAELPIVVDKDLANAAGVSTGQVAQAFRTSLFGKDIGTFKKGDKNYDITLRFGKEFRGDIDALLDQRLIFMNNRGQKLSIPVRSVVQDPKKKITFGSIKRKDLKNMVTISSGVTEGANPTEVVEAMKEELKKFQRSSEGITFKQAGFNAKFTGQMEQQEKEMSFLSTALGIAVFLILLIIVTQFNSYSAPAIILLAVVLSLTGVFLGLVFSRQDFVVIMTMIGIISLAGIVVNNAIVLIDYTKLLLEGKKEALGLPENAKLPSPVVKEAIIEAGKTRLRPVLLTAITTVLGLVPLATGFNIDFISWFTTNDPAIYIGGDNVIFFGPMSWTIIYGLTFATFLTLVVVPVTYYLLYKVKGVLGRLWRRLLAL